MKYHTTPNYITSDLARLIQHDTMHRRLRIAPHPRPCSPLTTLSIPDVTILPALLVATPFLATEPRRHPRNGPSQPRVQIPRMRKHLGRTRMVPHDPVQLAQEKQDGRFDRRRSRQVDQDGQGFLSGRARAHRGASETRSISAIPFHSIPYHHVR